MVDQPGYTLVGSFVVASKLTLLAYFLTLKMESWGGK
jgi:hypothetical protein